jgi:hypothetical protein
MNTTEARMLLGSKNVFGAEEWKAFYDEDVDAPEIPWTEQDLKHSPIACEHFLFLGLDTLGYVHNDKDYKRVREGIPLDLNNIWMHFNSRTPTNDRGMLEFLDMTVNSSAEEEFMRPWYVRRQPFAEKTCEFRWYLMTVGAMAPLLSYDDQIASLPAEYELPTVIALTVANMLYYLLNYRYMDAPLDSNNYLSHSFYNRTCDRTDSGQLVSLLNAGEKIIINFLNRDQRQPYNDVGITVSRKPANNVCS